MILYLGYKNLSGSQSHLLAPTPISSDTSNQISTSTATVVTNFDLDASVWKLYTNPNYGYSIKYPKQWYFISSDLSKTTLSNFLNTEPTIQQEKGLSTSQDYNLNKVIFSIGVLKEKYSGQNTLDWLKQTGYFSDNVIGEPTAFGRTTLSGISGISLLPNNKYSYITTFLFGVKHVYKISVIGSLNSYPTVVSDLSSTIQFTDKPAIPTTPQGSPYTYIDPYNTFSVQFPANWYTQVMPTPQSIPAESVPRSSCGGNQNLQECIDEIIDDEVIDNSKNLSLENVVLGQKDSIGYDQSPKSIKLGDGTIAYLVYGASASPVIQPNIFFVWKTRLSKFPLRMSGMTTLIRLYPALDSSNKNHPLKVPKNMVLFTQIEARFGLRQPYFSSQ